MIVITGLGRSGTSFVARLYRELGYDPGGAWDPGMNAGLENADIVTANRAIMRELIGWGVPRTGREVVSAAAFRLELPYGSTRTARALRTALDYAPRRIRFGAMSRLRRWGEEWQRVPRSFRWSRLDEVVTRHGPRVRELGRRYTVVKDPRFCWTLGVWAAAGAQIDHVIVCTRHLDASARSRAAVQALSPEDVDGMDRLKDAAVFRIGLSYVALHNHRLPYTVVRFPDFLQSPDHLFAVLPFPEEVTRERFDRAFGAVRQEGLVHDWR